MKRIAVLGSTGSIGTSTLAVVEASSHAFEVVALAAGRNLDVLRRQVRRHDPVVVSVTDPADALELAAEFPAVEFLSGPEGLVEVARHHAAEMVVVAVVGAAGLMPTMAAVEAGKDIALANKETLVVAGDLVMSAVARAGVALLPVDSEHTAIHQALRGEDADAVSRIVLTASGGPFRTWSKQAMATATVADALAHPTWQMGKKITIDSATLMNKGLEIIEAHHLFSVSEERIDVVIHPQSRIHAMVEFTDGSITATLSANDMRHSIATALSWPERSPQPVHRLQLMDLPALTFEEPDRDRFPALDLARAALREGGEMPAALNAANEVAVAAFLEGRCPLPAVAAVVGDTLSHWSARNQPLTGIEQFRAVDGEVRRLAADTIVKYGASVIGSEKRC